MSISIISQAHITGTGLVNVFTSSATAIAGDVMELALQYKNDAGAIFTPVWNGQSFIELAPRVSAAGFFFHRFYLIAASSATANITGGTSPTYTYLNRAWRVWRSSTSSFATPPFKAGSYQASNFTSGSYVNPNITNTLTSADVVSAVFASPNWNTGYGTGTATFTEDAPSVNIGECVSTAHAAVEILRSFYTEGTGSVASALTKTGAHNPMYQFSTVILQETAYLVTSINGGSPITSSQSAVAAITTGFTGLPTTITTNATGVTCGTISGTTNAPTWVQTVRTDGAVFPKSGTVVTYTFTNGAETANGNQTINKDADQTAVIVASPINDDITCLFGAIFAVTGRSAANGDEVYHTVPVGMSDLVVNPDGTMEVTNAGTFTCWVWTAATGVNYYYSVTITESGGAVVSSNFKGSAIKGSAVSGSLLKGTVL